MIDHFAGRGHHRFWLDPNAKNSRAIAAYEKVGFKPVGILRESEVRGDGSRDDALLMDLLVSDLA